MADLARSMVRSAATSLASRNGHAASPQPGYRPTAACPAPSTLARPSCPQRHPPTAGPATVQSCPPAAPLDTEDRLTLLLRRVHEVFEQRRDDAKALIKDPPVLQDILAHLRLAHRVRVEQIVDP